MKPFGSALLSYGLSGKVFHAPFLEAHPGYRLLGAWERSKSLIKADYPDVRSYRSIDEILDDPAVDLVIVNTPTYTHFDYASRALSAGKHIVVEKAFTTTVEEALQLEALANRVGKLLAVYQNRRCDGDFLAVKNVVRSGDLGEIVEAQLSFERYNLVLSPKAHREEPGPGAGNLMDLGPHLIDEALVLFGIPDAVSAVLDAKRPGSKVDDYFELILHYQSSSVKLLSSYVAVKPGPAFIIHGTKGSLEMPRLDIQETQLRQGISPIDPDYGKVPSTAAGTLTRHGKNGAEVSPLVPASGNYMQFFNGMFAALNGRGPVPVTGAEGTDVMRVLAAAQKSATLGKKISV